MLASLKKELSSFLGSVTGYVVICIFLAITSLFLWVFPSEMNIATGGYATLDGLFVLAPWVFLFLVPAITMKMLAEEKKSGTIELLLTRPLSDFQIVFSKFLAAVVLIVLSLLPTFVYFYSVYQLGNPVGNIDMGATWGSYLGLFFLAAIYAAIGLFASSLTENQVISFLFGVLLCFLVFTGFEYVATIFETSSINTLILYFGIYEHYESISRGVVDSRDVAYFLSVTFLFLFLTQINLRSKQALFSQGKNNVIGKFLAVSLFIVVINILSFQFFFRLDLTSDKRFTLSKPTKSTLKNLEETVFIKVYLDGDLPIGFAKMKNAIGELLEEFRIYSRNIEYNFINPYSYEGKDREAVFRELYEKNVDNISVRIKGEDGMSQKNIFPGAIISYRNAETSINLLSNNPGLPAEVNLNNSIQALEYQFIGVIKNITSEKVNKIAFIEGHGELDEFQVGDISRALSKFYQVDRGTINGQVGILDGYNAIIIAKPQQPFSEPDKYVLDQYLMNGGKILWFIDAVNVSADSLDNGSTLAFARELNLDDMLFQYGVRVNPQLIKDLQSNFLMVSMASRGSQNKLTPVPWLYYPLINGRQDHPISKNLNMVKTEYVNPIDTVGGNNALEKTVLLWTSPNTALVRVPALITLNEIDIQPNAAQYQSGRHPVAVLLEGEFPSVFQNRMLPVLKSEDTKSFKSKSKTTGMVVVSDGDIIRNDVKYTPQGNMIGRLGFDKNTNHTFGNKEFVLNAINYLADDDGLINLRSREFKLRLLDKQKLESQHTLWMLINIIFPVIAIVVFGIITQWVRKKKYN
jgi:ABC-2 type transport system permease protein